MQWSIVVSAHGHDSLREALCHEEYDDVWHEITMGSWAPTFSLLCMFLTGLHQFQVKEMQGTVNA